MLTTGEYKGPDYYNYDGSINPDSSYAQKWRKEQFGRDVSLRNDQISEADARNISPGLGSMLDQIDSNRRNSSNKINTSDNRKTMLKSQAGGSYGQGGKNAKNFVDEYSVALPPTMGGYRKKDMVDLELGREGRISPLVAVGQSKQSPNLGWVNDDARGVFGGEYRPYIPGGRGGINVSIRPNIQNTNTFNPQNTFTPETSATSNPTLQTAGGDIFESTAQGGGPYSAGRDITPIGTRGTATTGDSGDVISDAAITTTADNQSTATTGTGSGQTTATPVYNTPINNTPINNTPINNTPVDNTPINNTPVDNTPINNTPVDDTPINNTPVDDTPVDDTPVTRFSDDFATKSDAQNWLNQYYVNTLGRDAIFDDQFSDASVNASYWINELSKGTSTKDKVMSDIQLNPEFTNRKELVDQYRAVLGRDPLESELDALTGPGGQWLTGDTSAASISQNQLQQSPEFQGRNELVQLYNQHLGRNPTEAELDTYVGAGGFNLTNYTSADDVLQNVILPQVGNQNQTGGGGSSNNNNNSSSGGSSSSGGGGQSYGGGTQAQNYITNQAAYDAEQAARAQNITHSTSANVDSATSQADTTNLADTSTTVDDWLSDFYAEHGINEGKVDQTGRDYWTSSLANKSKAEVEKDILWAAANN